MDTPKDDKRVVTANPQIKERALTRKEEKQLILKLTEQRVNDKFSDRNLDRENEKFHLLGGVETSIKEITDNIRSKARKYSPMYHPPFWREMFRLFQWPERDIKTFRKKREAAIFINEVIYGRFDKGVLRSFHVLNPYTGYMTRHFKHFQFLTDAGIEKLGKVIEQAIAMMQESNSYAEFRSKWFQKYGGPYQTEIFNESTRP